MKHHIFRVVIKAPHVGPKGACTVYTDVIRIQTKNDFCCFPCV